MKIEEIILGFVKKLHIFTFKLLLFICASIKLANSMLTEMRSHHILHSAKSIINKKCCAMFHTALESSTPLKANIK